MLGCDGRTTTDTGPWSCNELSTQCPVTPEPAGLAGFWRFDAGDLGGEWRGDGSAPNWAECNDQRGGDWGREGGADACGTERLGGFGASLRLAASGYVAAALPEQMANSPMTLTAWISLNRRAEQPMSVVSVVRPSCQSAWLDVHTAGTNRKLVLSVEKPGDTDTECKVDEHTASLPSGFLDWGVGVWYHVGASVNGSETALFVDGKRADSSVALGLSRPPEPSGAVHIGADPTGGTLLTGMIDDVALFDRSLSPDELAAVSTEATSVLVDGQQWTPWSVDGTSSAWQADCRNPNLERTDQGVSIVVDKGYWSAGGLQARTPTEHRIGSLKKAVLVADIPNGEPFDFVLGSRHNAERCTWHSEGRGKQRYEFSLDDVKNCDCPSTCDCAFRVEEARVGARWDSSVDVKFSVCRVEFEWGPAEDPIVELGPGGMWGLNGWCWRPISYHPNASVDLEEELSGPNQTVATQRGGDNATAYLAADFVWDGPGDDRVLCDLTQVDKITLEADMPEGYSYQFRLADFYGVGLEWSRRWKRDEPIQEFILCPEQSGPECGKEEDPFPYLGRQVDREQIRHLGVQKTFETATDPSTITIKNVTFSGTPGDHCVISSSSGGAGPG